MARTPGKGVAERMAIFGQRTPYRFVDSGCDTGRVEDTSEAAPPKSSTLLPQTSVNLDWGEVSALEPSHVNQVMTQVGNPGPDGTPDGIYVGFGHVSPPIAPPGTNVAQAAEALRGSNVPVKALGRYHMSRAMVEKLIGDLRRVAEQYDALADKPIRGQG
jgi:hypothetical protein